MSESTLSAHLPDMRCPVIFCEQCATGFCMIVWDVDEKGEPTVKKAKGFAFCPVCGAIQDGSNIGIEKLAQIRDRITKRIEARP